MSREQAGGSERRRSDRMVSRRQASRRSRERRQQSLATYAVAAAIALSVLIILIPWAKRTFWDPNRSLATVAGQKITRSDYNAYYLIQGTGLSDPTTLGGLFEAYRRDTKTIEKNVRDARTQAEQSIPAPSRSSVETVVNDVLLAQSGPAVGLQLQPAQLNDKLDSYVRVQNPQTAPTPGATGTAVGPALMATPVPAVTSPTATAAGPAGSATAAATAAAPTPTLGPASAKDISAFFDMLKNSLGVSRQQYILFVLQPQLVREAFTARNVPATAEQVHVRHILVNTEGEARALLGQLKAGQKFEVLARQKSLDTATANKGGDVGWTPRGVLDPAFENAAFQLKKQGELSGPVKSKFGWHIIEALAPPAVRPLSQQQKATLEQALLSKFVEEQRKKLEQQKQLSISFPAPSPIPTAVPTAQPSPAGTPRP